MDHHQKACVKLQSFYERLATNGSLLCKATLWWEFLKYSTSTWQPLCCFTSQAIYTFHKRYSKNSITNKTPNIIHLLLFFIFIYKTPNIIHLIRVFFVRRSIYFQTNNTREHLSMDPQSLSLSMKIMFHSSIGLYLLIYYKNM